MAASRLTSLPRASPKPPRSMKSRCMSITTSAVVVGSKEYAYGRAAISGTGGGECRRRRVVAGHARADDGDVGPRGRGLVHDASAEDDREAVRELEQLVEIFADEQDGRAAVSRRQDPVVDLGDRREVEPDHRVGGDQ